MLNGLQSHVLCFYFHKRFDVHYLKVSCLAKQRSNSKKIWTYFSEMSQQTYNATRCKQPKDNHYLNNSCCENLITHLITLLHTHNFFLFCPIKTIFVYEIVSNREPDKVHTEFTAYMMAVFHDTCICCGKHDKHVISSIRVTITRFTNKWLVIHWGTPAFGHIPHFIACPPTGASDGMRAHTHIFKILKVFKNYHIHSDKPKMLI